MLQRALTSIGIAVVSIPICFLFHTWVFPIAVAICAVLGVYEMLECVGTHKLWFLTIPACLLAAAAPVCCRLLPELGTFSLIYTMSLLIFLTYLLSVGVFSRGKVDVEGMFVSFASVFYVITAFTSLVVLADRPFGLYFVLLTIFGPWISDVFAYLSGRFFGKHKLIPEISPKKTVEGMVGAILFTTAFSVVYGIGVNYFSEEITRVNYFGLLLAGAVVSGIAQVGDLIMSYIKRRYGIKDFGKLLPGHGGILDRFDSVLTVTPFLVLLTSFQEVLYFFA